MLQFISLPVDLVYFITEVTWKKIACTLLFRNFFLQEVSSKNFTNINCKTTKCKDFIFAVVLQWHVPQWKYDPLKMMRPFLQLKCDKSKKVNFCYKDSFLKKFAIFSNFRILWFILQENQLERKTFSRNNINLYKLHESYYKFATFTDF